MGIWNWLYRGGIRHWLYQGDGVDLQGCVMRALDWIRVIESICGGMPWGPKSLAGSGRWDWIMGICDNGWIGAMELFHGDMRHWLEQGNGVDLWWCVALAGTGDGIDSGGLPWGHTTLTGSGWWDWYVMGAYDWIGEMGLIWGGTPLGCDAGWDMSWGHDWIREMGLLCGLWDCGYGIDPWGVSNGKVLYGCWM